MDDTAKIQLVRRFDLAATGLAKQTQAASKEYNRATAALLTELLGRKPTSKEINEAQIG